jgi:hypothetical protein
MSKQVTRTVIERNEGAGKKGGGGLIKDATCVGTKLH